MTYCQWDKISELYKCYHAEKWRISLYDDQMQLEFLMLEAMQCGLSWKLMLQKREIFRKCFDNFDYEKVARYDEYDIDRILNTDGMIKSSRKIKAVINDAKCFRKIRKEFDSFCEFLRAYSDGKTILYEDHEKVFGILEIKWRKFVIVMLFGDFNRGSISMICQIFVR